MSTTAYSDAILSALRPRERIPVSAWADRHRYVSAGTSPEPGYWRTDRVPYTREILDAISDPGIERITLCCGSQLAKTEILLNAVGYYAHQDPAGVLIVQPTEQAAKSFAKERVEPMFRDSPALRSLLQWGGKHRDNEILIKQYPGGYMAFAWAGSAVSLASRPIRVVLMDEIDRYPPSTGKDGDPIAQAEQRTANFPNRKIVAVSTPTIDGASPIADAFAAGDQRYYHVPCPHCGAYQVLEWERLIYKNESGAVDLDGVHYRCEHCGGKIHDRDRPEMLRLGEWRADNPEADRTSRSYHISALYSPWVSWRTLCAQWVKINQNRDQQGRREFRNLRLGLPWIEEDQVNAQALEKNREGYDGIPVGVVVLTVGVDTQDNRLEAELLGWGPGKESWGIEYKIIPGDTSILPHMDPARSPWARLDEWIALVRHRADGVPLVVQCVAVDSGGHRTDEVYQFCRERNHRQVFAVKGMEGGSRPIVGNATLNKLRAPLYLVGDDMAKGAIYSRLAIEQPGPGYCHFPRGAGYDDEFFAGLTSEKRDLKMRAGRRVRYWKQLRARNEPLDCRKYATAALEILQPDTPGTHFNLDALARQLAAEAERLAPTAGERPKPAPPARPAGRRVLSRGVQF